MKKTVVLCFVMFTVYQSCYALPLRQSFEGSPSDNWSYSSLPPAYYLNKTIWDRVTDGGEYFTGAADGSWFWQFYDIDEIPGIPADGIAHLTFDTVDLSTNNACVLSFFYCNRGLDANDGMTYAIAYDNGSDWTNVPCISLPRHSEHIAQWVKVEIMIPANISFLRLRLSAYATSGADCGGFDLIELDELPADYPYLTIAAPVDNFITSKDTVAIDVSGTCSNCVGALTWSNRTSGVSGELLVADAWQINSIPLLQFENVISVSGTNSIGMIASDEIIVFRNPEIMIAFTAFNAARDAFAFTALSDIPPDRTIIFSDEEWDATEFVSTSSEGDITWNSGAGVTAGTVVLIDYCNQSANWSANFGNIDNTLSRNMELAQSSEEIYAYFGQPRQPLLFLAALSTSERDLSGTALSYGVEAISIPSSISKGAEYLGLRSGYENFAEYRTLLCDPDQWSSLSSIPNTAFFTIGDMPAAPYISVSSPTPDSFVEHAVESIVMSGTVENAVGHLIWSNAANNATGVSAAINPWSVVNIPLEPGENQISVTATNVTGLASSAHCSILRGIDLDGGKAGWIAFTSFNSEIDNFSFVALKRIPAATTIRFTDEEWNGVAFGTGEDDLVWSNSSEIVAGTVIAITNCEYSTSVGATVGIVVSGKIAISKSGEDIYAYIGGAERQPDAFLAAISTAGGELRGTALKYQVTAVNIGKTPTGQHYCGERAGAQRGAQYLPLINDATNWQAIELSAPSWGDTSEFKLTRAATIMMLK